MLLFIRLSWKWVRRGFKAFFTLGLLGIIGVLGLMAYAIVLGPPSLSTPHNTTYYLADGEVMEGYDVGASRKWISLEEIPEEVIDATLAIEDHRFYNHYGFDFKRIASAALTDLKTMEMAEGASTITQQFARNLYLSHEKTWTRKLKEAFYAIRLEIFYDKDEILEGYLNTIYYGHGAYGVESASQYFFNKKAGDLSLAEATMLAGVPKGPTYYSPLADEENAELRQERILNRMNDLEFITSSEKNEAVTASLDYYDHSAEEAKAVGPYFQDEVVREAARLLDVEVEAVESGGFHIYTTLNPVHQKELEAALDEEFDSASEIETAAVVMDSESGAVTAMAGGRDYSGSSFNRATQAKRMVGSTIKPFLYYAALKEGYSPLTMQESKPTSFELENGEVYSPSNYNNYYADDEITMAQALALSDNIYAVQTNLEIGPKKMAETLRDFGIKEDLPAVPSLALGTPSISLYDMVNGYSKLTSGSPEAEKHTITKITDHRENVLYEVDEETPGEKLKIDQQAAFSVTHMMTGIFDSSLNGYTSVTGSSIADQLSRTYGGKSGTTDSDSWMIGFSPDYVMGVWSGYDDNRSMTQPRDQQYSKELWANTMEKIHDDVPASAFKPPRGLRGVYINPESGKLSGPACPEERLVYVKKKDVPRETCEEEDSDIEKIEEELENDPWYKSIVDWFQ
ncbi:transglycosylase domain-containing protein [Halobacillus sp. A5]|uniref:transglycosylase domain-containing protein n=1 Tax=Halobacillus sp. A5 TaxID=2880263 RepID=UPI0020A6CEB3|nr:transglycosylase domain-containing protein [Halobacillus sp. A5]MCP3027533.1 penicillin-binding protein [Halobacillus sp. A5]